MYSKNVVEKEKLLYLLFDIDVSLPWWGMLLISIFIALLALFLIVREIFLYKGWKIEHKSSAQIPKNDWYCIVSTLRSIIFITALVCIRFAFSIFTGVSIDVALSIAFATLGILESFLSRLDKPKSSQDNDFF